MENRESTPGVLSRPAQGRLALPGSRYNPLHEMQEQMRRMDALLNRVFGYEPVPAFVRNEFQQLQQAEPDVDIYETDNEYILHAALPGVDPQDIRVEATEESIMLSAHRRSPFDTDHQTNTAHQTNQTDGQQTVGGQASAQRVSGVPSGQGLSQQSGQEPSQNTGLSAGTSAPTAPRNASGQNVPHTQHRQSRLSGQSRFRLVYALPTEINPDEVQANFRNGMLELHLPKQQRVSARTVPISIGANETSAKDTEANRSSEGTIGAQTTGNPTPTGGRVESNAASKMGAPYTPSPGEDHTMQAQAAGARSEHESGRETNPAVAGQANSTGTPTPTGANRL